MLNKKNEKLQAILFLYSLKFFFERLERHYFYKLIEIYCCGFVDINLKGHKLKVFLSEDKIDSHLCYHLIYLIVSKIFINFFQNLLKMSPFINYLQCTELSRKYLLGIFPHL